MRLPTLALALTVVACTSPPPAPRAAPTTTTPTPVTTATATPWRARYVSDLDPAAHHTLLGANGKVHLIDDAGRLVWSRWMLGGGWPWLGRGADGRAYVVGAGDSHEGLYAYAAGTFTKVASGAGYYPHGLLVSGGAAYRVDGGTVFRDVPRPGHWKLPSTRQLRPGADGPFKGDDLEYDVGETLAVVTTPRGPVVATGLWARCAVTALSDGRQVLLDADAPRQWLFCTDAAIAPDGLLAILGRESGGYEEAPDREVLLSVDPVTLDVVRRTVIGPAHDRWAYNGDLVALPGGLVAYFKDSESAYVADLRGARPVVRRVGRSLGYQAAAAGADAIWVWGWETGTSRVTLPAGTVTPVRWLVGGLPSGMLRVP